MAYPGNVASRNGNLKDIKLSFVGHSILKLIIRSALAESIMDPYLRYLYTYVSISGPHLGYMYSSTNLLPLQGQTTTCLCLMLFTKLPFTFIGFIIWTFLSKDGIE